MSNTYRRYRAIHQNLLQFYQPRPIGHQERQLNTYSVPRCQDTEETSFKGALLSAAKYTAVGVW